jgi:prolyl oligopeptidase
VLATVENGDGGEYQHFLRDAAGKWTQLTHYEDKISAVAFGQDGALYMVSGKDAPRGKMMRLPLTTPNLAKAQTIVPESDAVIQGFRFSTAGFFPSFGAWEGRLYVTYEVGGPTQVRVFDYQGHRLKDLPILPVSTVSQMVSIKRDLFFRNSSYLVPPAWYDFYASPDGTSAHVSATQLRVTSPVNFDDAEVVREFAVSKDGTKVPLNIIRRKGTKLDGNNPTILTGYGGFGLSLSPYFNPSLRMWLDAGGVYAIANLRGGGEFGEAWHQAGMLTHKQNVFDDFIACAQHLIQQRYTNPSKLGIEGGSNGGLLMAAAFTQHPELFRAVVSIAGLYDMLRTEQSANGQYNTTEYGSVKNPEQFRAMYAYSPYQHVRDGTKYPATLFIVGENDMRVESWQSRKMAARLQAANASKLPILLVSFSEAGHGGIGAARKQRIAMSAYAWSFLFDQLGVTFQSQPPEHSPV